MFLRPKAEKLPERIGMYRILRKIGAGGMGAVYEGLNESIERRVAIKVLHPRYSHDPETARRFVNEARAVNRIEHQGVVQISDHGHLDDGSAYIVMELLQGESLGARLRRSGALPAGECIDLGAQIAETLTAAHAKQIVHRDLKPDNIMVVPDRQMMAGERIKVLDFGIAKLTEGDRASAGTQTNTMLGTPYYMSPEQARGSGKVDDKTDVYSLGVILFEILAGKPLFEGEGAGELIMKHMSQQPPDLAEKAPGCPPELVRLVHRLLEKDRAARPSMAQCAEQLEVLRELYPRPRRSPSAIFPEIRIPQPPLPPPPQSQSGDLSGRLSTIGRSAGQAMPRRPVRLLAAGLGAALLAGTIVVVQLLHPQGRRPVPRPTSAAPQIEAPEIPQPPILPAVKDVPRDKDVSEPGKSATATTPATTKTTADSPVPRTAPIKKTKQKAGKTPLPVRGLPIRRHIED
jgi:serine/threonine-protein kinase